MTGLSKGGALPNEEISDMFTGLIGVPVIVLCCPALGKARRNKQ